MKIKHDYQVVKEALKILMTKSDGFFSRTSLSLLAQTRMDERQEWEYNNFILMTVLSSGMHGYTLTSRAITQAKSDMSMKVWDDIKCNQQPDMCNIFKYGQLIQTMS